MGGGSDGRAVGWVVGLGVQVGGSRIGVHVGDEQWLALSIATDEQWRAFKQAMGNPAWAHDERFDAHAGRLAGHDAIDREIQAWAEDRELEETVAGLISAGVPAATVVDPRVRLG